MNIREYRQPQPRKKRVRGVYVTLLFGTLTLFVAGATTNYLRPLPSISHTAVTTATIPKLPTDVVWPGYGQSAVATSSQGVLQTNGVQTPLATASIAKVITALCVLEKYPLKVGEAGPALTISATDVALYNEYLTKDGSVAAVQAGEQLTERQLLEGIMLPSANNLADTAAIWAYGNLEAYADYANKYVAMHGLTNTHIGVDASGFDPSSTSTASDLARLGLIALQEPALVQIMAETKADIPVAGTVRNYNALLGSNGVVGIKTGNNDQNPGAMLFAAKVPVGDKQVMVSGAVLGAGSLYEAMRSSGTLVASLAKNFSEITVVKKDQVVGKYTAPWGATARAVAAANIKLIRWNDSDVHSKVTLSDILPGDTTGRIGHIHTTNGLVGVDTQLQLDHPLAGPSFWWRLTRR